MRKHFLLFFLMSLLPLGAWAQDISEFGVKIQGYGAFEFNGGPQAVTLKVQMDEATDPLPPAAFEVKYYTSNGEALASAPKNAGTYQVSAKGLAPYYGETEKISYTIQRKSINSDAFIAATTYPTGITSFKYDGTAKVFATVTLGWDTNGDADVADESDVVLVQGDNKDFTIAYDKNVAAGTNTAELKITGVGNYKDTKTIKFSIDAANLPAEAAKYKFTALTTNPTYSGANVATLPTFSITGLTAGTDYEVEWHKVEACNDDAVTPKDVATYYLLAKGINNYAGSTKKDASWKFTVNQKNLIVYVQNMEKTYDGNAIAIGEDPYYITGAEIVLNGLEGNDATPEARAEFEASVKAKFETEPGVAKKNAGTYNMIPVITNLGAFANYKTEGNLLNTGVYTINKRSVTVTPREQKFTYDGTEKAISTDKIVLLADNSNAATATVAIEALNEEAKTGLVAGDAETFATLYSIQKKAGVTIKNKQTYTGAIEIKATEAAAASNYTIVAGPAANVVVGGADIALIAGTFSKQYGYVIDFTKDFFVVNNKSVSEYKTTPTFTVAKGDKTYTAADGALPLGTYTITLTNAAEIIPDNFEYKAENVYTGELNITPKEIEIEINTVNLKTGDGLTELNKYATVKDYSSKKVGNDKIDFTFKFADGISLAEGKLKAAAEYGEAIVGGVLGNAVDGVLVASSEDKPNDNAKYIITFVKGGIKLGTANTLVLDPADTQLEGKITDANSKEYAISFGSKAMKEKEWYAMVLPFATSLSELVDALGTYVVVNTLSDASSLDNIKFTLEMDEIPAGKPFIIKPAKAVNWSAFKLDDDPATLEINESLKTISKTITPTETAGATLTGVYTKKTIKNDPDGLVEWLCDTGYGKKDAAGNLVNTWLKPKSKPHDVLPLEAYMILAEGSSYAPVITVEDFDGSVTSIKSISVEEIHDMTAKGMYNLNGMKMNSVPTQKGVYIVNGKKVVIK